MSHKPLFFITIVTMFILFAVFEISKYNSFYVTSVDNSLEVKLNSANGKEISVCIDADAFSVDLNKNNSNLSKKINISNEDALKLGYLTDIYAENLLLNKKVKLKFTGKLNQNCKFADIKIDKESYTDKMFNQGYFAINGKFGSKFKEKLEKARKLNLAILNHKSNKYHKLNCEYGLSAGDIVVLPENQLPSDSVPCQYCHVSPKNTKNTPVKIPTLISQGNIKMYLTDFTGKFKPDNKCSDSLVCAKLLQKINDAKTSIDIAMYGWNNVPDLYNALLNAKNRGVKIRVVYDNSTSQYYEDNFMIIDLSDVSKGDSNKSLMHNKFIIFDNSSLLTGSMNFSKTGLSGFNSNCIFFIDSPELASVYKEEFEKMLDGNFSKFKSNSKIKSIVLDKSFVTPLFSPSSKTISNYILPLINKSSKYIYIPAFVITHDSLANSLVSAKARGVDVKIISDATSTTASNNKIKFLRNSGILLKIENYAGKIHSKSIIIDDKYVIAGSMNFSNSGENKNDENTLIIEDERLSIFYRKFFEYLWNKIPDKYLKFNPKPESKDSIGSCSDGIDNDYDGKIDTEDDSCI